MLKSLEDKRREKATTNIVRIQNKIESKVESFVKYSIKGSAQMAYIIGLLCGKGMVDVKNREMHIRVMGGVLNSMDRTNRGFIHVKNVFPL